MKDLTTNEYVDRLPVLVSGGGEIQLLGVPKMGSGTGEAQASAVLSCLNDWGICDRVQGLCFDTTASNTGNRAGACVLLEQKLDRDLLFLACRHHVFELVIGSAFEKTFGASSGPSVLLFQRFQKQWEYIDKKNFQAANTDEFVANAVSSKKAQLLTFAKSHLMSVQPRDDYREFLELAIIFLGESPDRGVHFMAPGAMHHARWMAKVIYVIKLWLFRAQFKLTNKELQDTRDLALFAVLVHLKAWNTAQVAVAAPWNDLQLLSELFNYPHHKEIATATSKKMTNHTWYLSEELVGLAFFDPSVPYSTKKEMVLRLQEEGSDYILKRPKVDVTSLGGLESFVTSNTRGLFMKLKIETDFIEDLDPESWDVCPSFKSAQAKLKNLAVVNDHAERGVALVQEFNGHLTKGEEQLQFLLQVISEHRKKFPDTRKETLMVATKPGNKE